MTGGMNLRNMYSMISHVTTGNTYSRDEEVLQIDLEHEDVVALKELVLD